MSASDTARITHQLGRPRATAGRNPSVVSVPPPTTRHTIRTGHTCRTGRSGAQAPLAAVPAGVERSAIASGQGGQLGHRIAEDVMGVEDLDLVGSHPLPVQVDQQRANSSRSVSVRENPSAGSSGPNGTDRPLTSLDRKSWRRRRQRMAERRSSTA